MGREWFSKQTLGSLVEHPAIELAAVVAPPDGRLGEVGVAFVRLAAGAEVTEADVIAALPREDRELQGPAPRRLRRGLPDDGLGRDPEGEAAGGGAPALRAAVSAWASACSGPRPKEDRS